MSLSAILGNALSGMQASQLGLRTASNNVANVNTPGYARTTPVFTARSLAGVGMGVDAQGVKRVADTYLQAATFRAGSNAAATRIAAEALDRLQSQFGGLNDQGSIFSRLNQAFSSLSSASVDPAMAVARLSAAADLQSFFDESRRLSGEIRTQRQEADSRIASTVGRVNELLVELEALNAQVQTINSGSGDSSGAANRQAELLDELADYLDIRIQTQGDGKIVVRTSDGVPLLDHTASVLSYTPSGNGGYDTTYGKITILPRADGGQPVELDSHIKSGALRGLIDLRDRELTELAAQLGELAAGAADALNAAHNDSSAVPPPDILTGRNTGLLASDALGFTGATTVAIVDGTGALVRRIDIDFDAGTLSVDGGAPAAFGGGSIGDFVTALDGALGADGSASFANGVLEISGSAGNGVATLQDETSPAERGGRGFAHFFGLNDLVTSSRPIFHATGLGAADPHGFAPGSEMHFRISTADGRTAQDVTITVGGASMGDLLAALNDPVSGLGRYQTFSLDASGSLVQTPVAGFAGYDVALTADGTSRGATGLSFSQIFGLGLGARAGRAEGLDVHKAVRADSSLLSLAKLDLTGATAPGEVVLTKGDGRGGTALQDALNGQRTFGPAGGLVGGKTSLRDYAARLAGDVGARAARAGRGVDAAESLRTAAIQKRADVEGVSLDEELANMTLYQQSYNASARLLQAAKEMTDVLLSLV